MASTLINTLQDAGLQINAPPTLQHVILPKELLSTRKLTMSNNAAIMEIFKAISASPFSSISCFLDTLLSSERYCPHLLVRDLHNPTSVVRILDLLWRYQTESAITNWAAEKMCHTCTDEMRTITEKCQKVTPHTWALVQVLLDANKTSRKRFEPAKDKPMKHDTKTKSFLVWTQVGKTTSQFKDRPRWRLSPQQMTMAPMTARTIVILKMR